MSCWSADPDPFLRNFRPLGGRAARRPGLSSDFQFYAWIKLLTKYYNRAQFSFFNLSPHPFVFCVWLGLNSRSYIAATRQGSASKEKEVIYTCTSLLLFAFLIFVLYISNLYERYVHLFCLVLKHLHALNFLWCIKKMCYSSLVAALFFYFWKKFSLLCFCLTNHAAKNWKDLSKRS